MKVEQGLPPPPERKSWVEVLKELGVGSSVVVESPRDRSTLLAGMINRFGRGSGRSQKIAEGFRVWRVK